MKLGIVGDVVAGKEEGALRTVKAFIEDHKGGNVVVMVSGSVRLVHVVDNYCMDKGYPCVIMGNVHKLTVMNADKMLLLQTKAFELSDVVAMAKENNKPVMFIK